MTDQVEGVIEGLSAEGVLGAPAGCFWVKLDSSATTYLANVSFVLQGLKVGNRVRLELDNGRLGQMVKSVELLEKDVGSKAPEATESSTPETVPNKLLSSPPALTTPPALSVANPDSILSPAFSVRTDIGGLDDADLAYSVKEHGILQPILVRKNQEGKLERVAGGRRLRAARSAKLTSMPIILVQMSDADSFLAQLVENLHRKDLSDEEKGRAFKHALEKFPDKFPNQEALAKALGKQSRSFVPKHIDVAETVNELKAKGVSPGKLGGLTARQVAELKKLKPEERKRIIEESEELPSSREIEEEAEKPGKRAPAAATGRPHEPAKPTGQFLHCKECGTGVTMFHKSNTSHLLKSVREVER